MDLLIVSKMLGSVTRLNLLRILAKNVNLSAIEIYRSYNNQFKKKRRETLYKELERLADSGLVEKKYLKNKKKLVYNLSITKINIDLNNFEINAI